MTASEFQAASERMLHTHGFCGFDFGAEFTGKCLCSGAELAAAIAAALEKARDDEREECAQRLDSFAALAAAGPVEAVLRNAAISIRIRGSDAAR